MGARHAGATSPAFEGVSWAPAPGLHLLLGPSGAGKSSLALCLAGLLPGVVPGSRWGSMTWAQGGAQPTPASVGLVFQDADTQLVALGVGEEVAFGLECAGVAAADIGRRVGEALERVGLGGREQAAVLELSAGQRQRLALADWLALDPQLLLLDEASSLLDGEGARLVTDLALEKAGAGGTVIMVEHQLDRVAARAHSAALLGRGGEWLGTRSPADAFADQGLSAEVWRPEVAELVMRLRSAGLDLPGVALDVTGAAAMLEPVARIRAQEGGAAARELSSPRVERLRRGFGATAWDLSQVCYRHRGAAGLALTDVDLRVGEGELVAVVGGNGAGKSTLALLMAGLRRPSSGRVRNPERVGLLFQNPEHQLVAGTVRADVAAGPPRRRPSDEAVAEQVRRWRLQRLAERDPHSLSQGEKRRLALAGLMASDPPAVVLDEPGFGLDRRAHQELVGALHRLRHSGRTIILVTHDLRLVAEEADRVVGLSAGRIAYDGSPADLLQDGALMRSLRLAAPPMVELNLELRRRVSGWPALTTLSETARLLHGAA